MFSAQGSVQGDCVRFGLVNVKLVNQIARIDGTNGINRDKASGNYYRVKRKLHFVSGHLQSGHLIAGKSSARSSL